MATARNSLLGAALAAIVLASGPAPGSAQQPESSAPGIAVPAPPPNVPYTPSDLLLEDTVPFGGQADTLEDCMGYWSPESQMSKSEWRRTCELTMNEVGSRREAMPAESKVQRSNRSRGSREQTPRTQSR
jgi:hypothetical protein